MNNEIDDDFDFVIAQAKGACAGTVTYVCTPGAPGGNGYIITGGGCSGTCPGSQVCVTVGECPLPCNPGNFGKACVLSCGCQT